MTDLSLTELREIAKAATPGPWNLHTLRTDETHDIRGSIDDEANIVIYAECEDADAAHVATFDPPTVLALIARLEAAEAKVERGTVVMSRKRATVQDFILAAGGETEDGESYTITQPKAFKVELEVVGMTFFYESVGVGVNLEVGGDQSLRVFYPEISLEPDPLPRVWISTKEKEEA